MKKEVPFKGLSVAVSYLSTHLPSVKSEWRGAAAKVLPEKFRNSETAAFLDALMEDYLSFFVKALSGADSAERQAHLETWIKKSFHTGLKLGDLAGLMFVLKRVLINKLVQHFRQDTGLLRRICDRVEQHLDESLIMISDGFQKLNETALRRANIELEHANRKLRDLGRFKDHWLAGISHDLRTPLSSVRGYVEMILDGMMGPVSSEQKKGLSVAIQSIDRLAVMVEELLACAGIAEQMRPALSPERFRLKDLVTECLDMMKPDAEKKGVLLLLGPSPADLWIQADPLKIHKAITNLLSNAIKFNKKGGRVEVSFFLRNHEALIRIQDSGIGIPEEAREKIFEKSFRLDPPSSGPPEGRGIGLAMATEMIRLHGGRMDIDSEEGRGTTLEIILPFSQKKAAVDRER